MSHLENDRILRALLRQPTDYTPVWLMRQAGRYLPEYRTTRAKAGSFLALAKNPEHATEVTLQPLARYPLDAAILFSDILMIPDAMGLGLHFIEGEGPKFERPVRDDDAVSRLAVPDMSELQYVFSAVALIQHELAGKVPLIGFAGSPWTIACYMVEGGSSSDFRTVKTMLYSRPDLLHRILEINADAVAAYLNAQIDAGADAVMIFDTWGGTLADGAFQEFSMEYMRRVVDNLTKEHRGKRIPSIVFTKGGGLWLEQLADIGVDALGVDWTVNLSDARARVGARCALQGNLDPTVLFAPESRIRAEVQKVIDDYGRAAGSGNLATGVGSRLGHVFNLGHGVSQFTSPDAVAVLIDAVHQASSESPSSAEGSAARFSFEPDRR